MYWLGAVSRRDRELSKGESWGGGELRMRCECTDGLERNSKSEDLRRSSLDSLFTCTPKEIAKTKRLSWWWFSVYGEMWCGVYGRVVLVCMEKCGVGV